ncbi:hypothetical protein [Bacillus sp. AFS031507]|uniref:hypothetical protein n=1 Tax=Bacillus sp. AFS031507 TaxID=2033496 RepID=UPI000BFB34DE|nr:hypothetical protein [Bacillus sp. AFS031507]PGY12686.1 hypothetical protein COE25_10000 [Bacillus sp. AFS031507]
MSIPIAEASGFERIGFKAALSLRGLPQVPLLHQTEVFSFAFLFFMMIIFRGDWRKLVSDELLKAGLITEPYPLIDTNETNFAHFPQVSLSINRLIRMAALLDKYESAFPNV